MSAVSDLDPQSWQRFNRLLDQALECAPGERLDWIESLGAEHEPLKPALRAVLRRSAAVETAWLATLPRDGAVPVEASDLRPDTRIGAYRLLREIGHGGMGAVWLAERADGTLNRQVALKLPRAAWSGRLAERMARERDILAALEHPNIARLYDAGTDAHGRPFLALEYVEGQPIDAYCGERALTVRQRLQLLLDVARAVAFAHSRLVIHRDLKPSNILVTADGSVRLLDFGIAKLMEGERAAETQLTQLGGRVLTPDFASPEQIRGESIGTTSDVYSLGVVAYELLTNAKPYRLKRGSAAELEEAITTGEAPLASTAASDPAARNQLKGDLDAILNQALRKDAAERYPSVEAFARDIERFLRSEPVLARPDSRGYRLRKFVARNRLAVGAAAAVALAVLGGATVALWQANEAREQTRIARTEAQTAAAVQDFLQSVFRANSGEQEDPMRSRQRTARDILDEGSVRIENELNDAPAAKLRVLQTLVDMNMDVGNYDRVKRLLELRVALAERLHPEPHALRVRALAELANQASRMDADAEAFDLLTRADAMAQQLSAVDDDAAIALGLAWADYWSRKYDERGIEYARRAAELLARRPPSPDLVRTYTLQGDLERNTGRAADAVRSLRRAIAVADQLPGGGRAGRVNPLLQLAFAEAANGDRAAAEAVMREGVQVSERYVGPASTWTLNMLANLAQLLAQSDRLREALDVLQDARERLRDWPESQEKALVAKSIVFVETPTERRFGRPERSIAAVDAWDALEPKHPSHPTKAAGMLAWRAAALTDLGQLVEAQRLLERATAVRADSGLKDYSGIALLARVEIAHALATQRVDRAREALQRWVAHPMSARSRRPDLLAATAEVALASEGPEAAAEAVERGLAELELPAWAKIEQANRSTLHLVMARARLAQGRAEDAKRSALLALEQNALVCDVEHSPARLLALVALADAQLALGDRGGAKRSLEEAQAIRQSHVRLGPQYLGPLERVRSALAARRGRLTRRRPADFLLGAGPQARVDVNVNLEAS